MCPCRVERARLHSALRDALLRAVAGQLAALRDSSQQLQDLLQVRG